MKKLSILGSTGSVGTQALDVVRAFPEKFEVVALAAGRNVDLLVEQIREFRPRYVSIASEEDASVLKDRISTRKVEVLTGEEGLISLAALDDVDTVLCAVVGRYGLRPALEAVRAGKRLALANKESLVMAGEIIMREAGKNDALILPVDSEHNAVFQVLEGRPLTNISRIVITASGGPFLNMDLKELDNITVKDALQHPVWSMGEKITIDSATMMNKCFEIIEAHWLFQLDPSRIGVVVHPQSVVHAIVDLMDGSSVAVMFLPDMRIPILYALSYPERYPFRMVRKLNLEELGTLEFLPVDSKKYPAINLAYSVLEEGGTAPAVMAVANDVAVAAFLQGKIKFTSIVKVVFQTLLEYKNTEVFDIQDVLDAAEWAEITAKSIIRAMGS